jgi:actin related protein 2/3 complex subunit 5
MANINWRTINIDALDPDSPANFDLSSLTPAVTPVSTADVQNYSQQIRQLLRGGDNEGALQAALENPPYGADDKGKVRCGMLPHHHYHHHQHHHHYYLETSSTVPYRL